MPPKVICSACILGARCRYHGRIDTSLANRIRKEAARRGLVPVPVCPEMLGGLPCPRPPARRRQGRIWHGTRDVTAAFEAGARAAVRIAADADAQQAWLFWRSPSCDPEFGIAARFLADAGLAIIGWGYPGPGRYRRIKESGEFSLPPICTSV